MSSAVEEHVLYQIANAPMREYPYAHVYIENIFPPDFYANLRAHWPDASSLVCLGDTGPRARKGRIRERFIHAVHRRPESQKLEPDRQP